MPRTFQPLHIFKKDVTHLWPETLIVLGLFAACAWSAHSRWIGSEYSGPINLLSYLLKLFLMPIAWLVVISRLIHDEPLVGDRQFWTSRPYHWASLFAAKVLYLLAFLYLPFLLMQVYLLKHAGLYPSTVIPAMLHNLLLLTIIVVVPIAAISAVTSTFPRALLSFIAAVIYVIVIALVLTFMVLSHMPPPVLGPVFATLIILFPLGALIYQYATRRTNISRIILIATPALLAILLLITPASALIRHAYPVATTPTLSQFPASLGPKGPQPGNLFIIHGKVQIGIPFTVQGADQQSNYGVSGVSATVDAPGVHWTSPYTTPLPVQSINAGSPYGIVPIVMPIDIFNKAGHIPANVHLSLAVEHLKADSPTTWKTSLQPFAVPGHGVCTYSAERPDDPPTCNYPFKAPDVNYVSGPLAQSCNDPAAPKTQGFADLREPNNLLASGAFLDFDPVVSTQLQLTPRGQQQASGGVLCPGTPLSFIQAHDQAKMRLEVDEKDILLENYATHATDRTRQPLRGAPAEIPGPAPAPETQQ